MARSLGIDIKSSIATEDSKFSPVSWASPWASVIAESADHMGDCAQSFVGTLTCDKPHPLYQNHTIY